MAKMALNKKTDKELADELVSKRKSLREFRFGMFGSKTKNVREGRNLKKEIARVLTEINKRK